jgi:hypothetical protein
MTMTMKILLLLSQIFVYYSSINMYINMYININMIMIMIMMFSMTTLTTLPLTAAKKTKLNSKLIHLGKGTGLCCVVL